MTSKALGSRNPTKESLYVWPSPKPNYSARKIIRPTGGFSLEELNRTQKLLVNPTIATPTALLRKNNNSCAPLPPACLISKSLLDACFDRGVQGIPPFFAHFFVFPPKLRTRLLNLLNKNVFFLLLLCKCIVFSIPEPCMG